MTTLRYARDVVSEKSAFDDIKVPKTDPEMVEIATLPYATVDGASNPVPYGNFYVCNGAVMVPTVDGGEARWLDLIGEALGDREVVAVPGEVLAYGGGGVHCITQQVIAP